MNWKNISCSTATLYDGSRAEAPMFTFKIRLARATPITKCRENHMNTQCSIHWISCQILVSCSHHFAFAFS